MNIYKLEQDSNNGYDTYDSCVVVAKSEEDAKLIHPAQWVTHISNGEWMGTYQGGEKEGKEYVYGNYDWISLSSIDCIKVTYLGKADKKQKRGCVLSSFNAG